MSCPVKSKRKRVAHPHLALLGLIGGFAGFFVVLSLLGPVTPAAHAQELPPHVFIGAATVNGAPVPDGTTIAAYVEGVQVGQTVIEGGSYTLLVVQPRGRSFPGKIVSFTIDGRQAREHQAWETGGAHELNLSSGEIPAAPTGAAGPLDGSFECIIQVLGRLPAGARDMSDQERIRVFRQCPGVRNNLNALIQMGAPPKFPQAAVPQVEISPMDQLLKELREVDQEISRIERETPLKIQRTLDQVQQEITNLERDLWDKLQFELDRLDQQRYETERQLQQELRSADFRRHSQIEYKFRLILDNLERERFETERRTHLQIDQEVGRVLPVGQNTERQMWDDKQRELDRLEQRRFELEGQIDRERMAAEQKQMDDENERRIQRERQMEEQRFRQQEELERQRIEQERQRFEQERLREEERLQRERQLEDERFRHMEQLDRGRNEQERQRMEQDRRLDQERSGRGRALQAGLQGPDGNLRINFRSSP